MKIRLFLTTLVIVIVSSFLKVTQAQARPNGVTSLAEMICTTIQGGDADGHGFRAINKDVGIGFEVFTAVAALGGRNYIDEDQTTQVACRLAAPQQQNFRYKTLTLAFGIPESDAFWDSNSSTRVSIYLDGAFYTYQDVAKGEKYFLAIDVTNKRSVGLEARCISAPNGYCGLIHFFEDTLDE